MSRNPRLCLGPQQVPSFVCFGGDPGSSVEMGGVVVLAQVIDSYAAGRGSMDEFVVFQVDSHM